MKYRLKGISKAFQDFSETERVVIDFWIKLLEEWHTERAKYKNKAEFDEWFVRNQKHNNYDNPKFHISTDILYRKYAAYKNECYGDFIDNRGSWSGGKSKLDDDGIIWQSFLSVYLEQSKPKINHCYRMICAYIAEEYPELMVEIPSESCFRRKINTLPFAVLEYSHNGEKAMKDHCIPSAKRNKANVYANDGWVMDNYTLDVIIKENNSKKTKRLYITIVLDAKSGVLTGWNIDDSASSDSVRLALRHGIMHYGIPKCIYVDNGREYLNHQLGGRGHRIKKNENPESEPPPIFKRLGIEMRNAIVRNAKSKPIERTFYTVKNQFSKLWNGFCGGTILERPESLKRRIKDGKLPCDYEIREILDTWIKNEYNLQPYGGSEQKYKELSRLDVWNKTCSEMRKISESALNLMLMRTTRKQKIKRNGVYVTICGEKIWFMESRETIMNLEKEVYVRYDPADLRTARIYDAETDKYMFTWLNADQLMVDYLTEKKEEISDAKAIIGESKKFIREQAKGIRTSLSNHQKLTLLEMTVRRAHVMKSKKFRIVQPKKIVPVIVNETAEDRMAVGAENVTIDLKRMRKNAEMRRKK